MSLASILTEHDGRYFVVHDNLGKLSAAWETIDRAESLYHCWVAFEKLDEVEAAMTTLNGGRTYDNALAACDAWGAFLPELGQGLGVVGNPVLRTPRWGATDQKRCLLPAGLQLIV